MPLGQLAKVGARKLDEDRITNREDRSGLGSAREHRAHPGGPAARQFLHNARLGAVGFGHDLEAAADDNEDPVR